MDENCPPERRYLSIAELCRRYSVSRTTVWRWVGNKTLPAPHHLGGARRWRLDELVEYEERAAEGA